MRQLQTPILLLVPMVAIAPVSCASSQKTEGAGGDAPAARVERIMPMAQSLDASAIVVKVAVANPRNEPMTISKVDYQIDTMDVGGVLSGSSEAGSIIEPLQRVEVEFEQAISFPSDVEAYQAVLKRGTIPIKLSGTVVFSDGTRTAFSKNGEVATPTLPQLVVHDAQAARYGEKGLDVTFFLRLINENVFPVNVQEVRYTIAVNDKQVKEQNSVGVKLLSGGAEEYEVSAVLDEKKFDKAALKSILDSGSLVYRVAGTVTLSRLEVPFEHQGEIRLGGSGE